MVVERKGTQFRVVAQEFSTDWWEDTPSNRKGMVVFLRRLEDALRKPLFTYDQLAQVLESPNRQAGTELYAAVCGLWWGSGRFSGAEAEGGWGGGGGGGSGA